jgi:phospho-N-acetylmuramoyl-pentapeptide-transferase
MDGLAGGTSFFVFATLAVFLALVPGGKDLAIVAGATAGALLGFLLYNKFRARIFMGDTGSLFLGALMAGLVVYGGLIVWFIPMALIYIVETISVMSQVVYFKLTKPYTPEKSMSAPALALYKLTHKLPGEGKRLFRMAPIHHHFEAVCSEKGIKEWEVVIWFWIAQALLCALCLFGFSHTV